MRKNFSEELIRKILEYNNSGLTNREIAKACDISHVTVSKYLKKHDLLPNGTTRRPIDIVRDGIARCRKCGEEKDVDEFSVNRKGKQYEYRLCYCFSCRKKQSYDNLNSSNEKFLSDRYNRLKRRANKLNVKCEITKEEFIKLFEIQNGKCFYTDETMELKVGQGAFDNSMSIDKIIPEKGYVSGNVVLCCNRINTCKNNLSLSEIEKWMPEWYRRIKNFLDLINESSN